MGPSGERLRDQMRSVAGGLPRGKLLAFDENLGEESGEVHEEEFIDADSLVTRPGALSSTPLVWWELSPMVGYRLCTAKTSASES